MWKEANSATGMKNNLRLFDKSQVCSWNWIIVEFIQVSTDLNCISVKARGRW